MYSCSACPGVGISSARRPNAARSIIVLYPERHIIFRAESISPLSRGPSACPITSTPPSVLRSPSCPTPRPHTTTRRPVSFSNLPISSFSNIPLCGSGPDTRPNHSTSPTTSASVSLSRETMPILCTRSPSLPSADKSPLSPPMRQSGTSIPSNLFIICRNAYATMPSIHRGQCLLTRGRN